MGKAVGKNTWEHPWRINEFFYFSGVNPHKHQFLTQFLIRRLPFLKNTSRTTSCIKPKTRRKILQIENQRYQNLQICNQPFAFCFSEIINSRRTIRSALNSAEINSFFKKNPKNSKFPHNSVLISTHKPTFDTRQLPSKYRVSDTMTLILWHARNRQAIVSVSPSSSQFPTKTTWTVLWTPWLCTTGNNERIVYKCTLGEELRKIGQIHQFSHAIFYSKSDTQK